MADNVQLNGVSVGGGAVMATEEIGGVHFQAVIPRAATATESSVAASASSVEVLAANANRISATIRNDSSAVMYLSMGGTASSSSPIRLGSQDIYELSARYAGAISAIWESATGNARVLEFA